jgi:hypothetical protein
VLNELAVLQVDHYAAIEPDRVNTKRVSLDALRQGDQLKLQQGISVLMQRKDSAAEQANQNPILHPKALPAAASEARKIALLSGLAPQHVETCRRDSFLLALELASNEARQDPRRLLGSLPLDATFLKGVDTSCTIGP